MKACVGGKKEIVDYLYNEFKVKLDEPDDVRINSISFERNFCNN